MSSVGSVCVQFCMIFFTIREMEVPYWSGLRQVDSVDVKMLDVSLVYVKFLCKEASQR